MHLSTLFILALAILSLFPLLNKLKYNIRLFLSFLLSFSITTFLYYMVFINSSFFLEFNNLYLKGEGYFSLLSIDQNRCVFFLQMSFTLMLFIAIFCVLFILFKYIFKEKVFNLDKEKDVISLVLTIFFKVLNVVALLLVLAIISVVINQFLELEVGFLNRFYELILKWVFSL